MAVARPESLPLTPSGPSAVRVRLDDVEVRRGGAPVLRGIDLTVHAGEVVAVVGPSGAGATTLLRVLAGAVRPTAGVVRRGDGRRRIPIADGARPGRMGEGIQLPPFVRRATVTTAALAAVGLPRPVEGRRPCRGDRQRLALARAVSAREPLLLLDDPLSALQAAERAVVRERVARMLRHEDVATVWVTRDTTEAVAVADRVVVLVAGRILAEGRAESIYASAADPGVAAVLGPVSAVPGIVDGDVVDVWGQRIPLAAAAHDGHCEVVVRPQDVLLVTPDAPGVDAIVERTTTLGASRHSLVRAADGTLVHVEHPARSGGADQERVRIALAPGPVLTRPLGGAGVSPDGPGLVEGDGDLRRAR